MPGGRLGHAIPNGGRGGMLGKGGGGATPLREVERTLGRRAGRLRQLERPEPDLTSAERSPVYRDRRTLNRRGRQLMDNNVRASWRALKNDGTMAVVSVTMVALLAGLTATVDLRQALVAVLGHLPLGPQSSQALLEAATQWRPLEMGCWWSAAILLAFFTWLLYAALFDTIGMILGTAPALAAGTTVFAARIAPTMCSTSAAQTSSSAGGFFPSAEGLCSLLPWAGGDSLLPLAATAAVAIATAALCTLALFALRPRLPGPDQALALGSAAILSLIALTACGAPASWEVLQMAAVFFAAVDDPLQSPPGSLAHLETGLWAAGAILLAFFSWLLFAALYDAAGMMIGVVPAGAAASLVVALRVVPAACRADPALAHGLHPQLCTAVFEFPSAVSIAAVIALLLGSSWAASWIHRSKQKKVLVVHSPLPSPSATTRHTGHQGGRAQPQRRPPP